MAEQDIEDPDQNFADRAEAAFRDLFDRARAANEVHFALALMPEFRGMQDAGWSTPWENIKAYDELVELINELDPKRPACIRVAISLYLYVSEASGLYEVPKKLMLTVEGKGNNMIPFSNIVDRHRATGATISPNANKVMKDLIGLATNTGFTELADIFDKSVDFDLRNGAAHADYILWNDGVRLPKKNGGQWRVISWPEFDTLLRRALNLFGLVRGLTSEYQYSYNTPKTFRGRMRDEPESDWTISCSRENGFKISGGASPSST